MTICDDEKQYLIKIRLSAMNILAYREHSIVELQKKLQNKFTPDQCEYGNCDEFITKVLQQLVTDKLLDDERFTECFVRSRINKGSGPVKIRHELMLRGVANELSDAYVNDSYTFWQPYIVAVREKRFGIQYPKSYKEQAKQARFLYQRGFSSEFIYRLFSKKLRN